MMILVTLVALHRLRYRSLNWHSRENDRKIFSNLQVWEKFQISTANSVGQPTLMHFKDISKPGLSNLDLQQFKCISHSHDQKQNQHCTDHSDGKELEHTK